MPRNPAVPAADMACRRRFAALQNPLVGRCGRGRERLFLLLSTADIALGEGGWGRLLASAAASGSAGQQGLSLVALAGIEGTLYHMSNVGTFTSIEIFDPLSFAIIDTLRRLCVVVSGFFYQGNECTVTNACGIALVIGGAGAYNIAKSRAAAAAAALKAKQKKN